jgi:hypothetical protein
MSGDYWRRLFADDYSAGGQLSWIPDDEEPLTEEGDEWRRQYLGLLRFDSILSDRLVIPDSHLIDGRFLLSVPAMALRNEIGRPARSDDASALELPLTFRIRARSLRETIATFLRTNDDHLNAFSFKTIPRRARRPLAAQLRARRWTELEDRLRTRPNPTLEVGRLLRECLRGAGFEQSADAWVGPLERGWSTWLELEDAGALKLEQYPWGGFDLASALAAEQGIEAEMKTELGQRAWRTVDGLITDDKKLRSQANEALDQLRDEASGDPQQEDDVRRVDAVASRIRYRAIALQHEAAFMRTVGRTPVGASDRVLERVQAGYEEAVGRRLELPEAVTHQLGSLPSHEYTAFLSDERTNLSRWRESGEIEHLRSAMATLGELLFNPAPATDAGLLLLAQPLAAGVATSVTTAALGASAVAAGAAAAVGAVGAGGLLMATGRHRRSEARARVLEPLAGLELPIVTSDPPRG